MQRSIDPTVALAAIAAVPQEHILVCTGMICPDNLGCALKPLWEHDIHVPTIVINPYRLRNMMDAMWYADDTIKTDSRSWLDFAYRLMMRRSFPIHIIPSPLWHLGTFRGYGYGSPIHASARIPRDTVAIYDPRGECAKIVLV